MKQEWYGYGLDADGTSWGHFHEETIDLHWSVIFGSGFIIGGIFASVLWVLL